MPVRFSLLPMLPDTWFLIDYMGIQYYDQRGCFGFLEVSVPYLEYSIMTGNNDQVGCFGFVRVSYLEEKQKVHVAPFIFCETHQLYFGEYIVINLLTIQLG